MTTFHLKLILDYLLFQSSIKLEMKQTSIYEKEGKKKGSLGAVKDFSLISTLFLHSCNPMDVFGVTDMYDSESSSLDLELFL